MSKSTRTVTTHKRSGLCICGRKLPPGNCQGQTLTRGRLAEITAIIYLACCPAYPRLIQYIRGTKTVKPAVKGFKTEKDLFSATSSFSSSGPNTPEQKHGWGSPIVTPPTPPKGSPKITPPTPPNGSPTLPSGFAAPQKPAQASVRVTPGPAQGSRSDAPRGPFRTLSLPVKPSVPRTSFQLPATKLDPRGPRLNFSIPVRPSPEQLANQSSLSPRYVPEEKTSALANKAEAALQNYAPFERRISHLSYTSRHTAAIEEIRQSLEEVRHSLDGGFIDTTPTPTSSLAPPTPGMPKTPTTPASHARSPSLAPPSSPGMPSPASPARTEFSVHLVESAVRMKIMPVYFAQRRKKSYDARMSVGSASTLGSQVMKPKMHSFRRSKHARVPSTPALQTHFEIPNLPTS